MLISRNWLQNYFTAELPSAEALGNALTFHAFEIDGIQKVGHRMSNFEDAILDVKVTPNRGHDCLSHWGIAKELSAILQLPLIAIPKLSVMQPDIFTGSLASVTVSVESLLCARYIAGYIPGIRVGPSPDWLRERLESIGQRSVNNVVDATNYVMFDLGQPLHAFDARKLKKTSGGVASDKSEATPPTAPDTYSITVRVAKAGETMLALDEKEYTLNESMIVIADANLNTTIGIAGVKGGMPAGITEATTDVIIESANFDSVSVRKTAQTLKLRTDASTRFEQVISPELAAYGMQAVVKLIHDIAGGELQEIIDVYPKPQEKIQVSVTLSQVQNLLGTTFGENDIIDSFDRLQFAYKKAGDVFVVDVPVERLDLEIPEDLVEEVGRIQGYDKVPAIELPPLKRKIEINKNFYWSEKIREFLVSRGFSEVFTSVFADVGERVVLNKVDGIKPHLRMAISRGLREALEKNIRNKDLLGLKQIKLFEIGSVWSGGAEEVIYDLAVENVKGEKGEMEYKQELEVMLKALPENPTNYDDLPLSTTERYAVYSKFPYIIRDVAFWTPAGTDEKQIEKMIQKEAGDLCMKTSLFDRFERQDKTSLAYRLIFQSFERTLTDEEVNAQMEKVYAKLKARGFEIR